MKLITIHTSSLVEIDSETELNKVNGGSAKDLLDMVVKVIRPVDSDKK